MTDHTTKLVILDFDGTIADTQSLITTTMMQTIEALGLESRTREECARMIGLPLKETFTRLIPMSDEMGDQCEATYRRLFDCNNTEGAVTLYPKVRETIEHLHDEDIAVSIASSRERKSLDRYVDVFGLRPFIDLVIGADNVCHAKPHPEPVLLTLRGRHGIRHRDGKACGMPHLWSELRQWQRRGTAKRWCRLHYRTVRYVGSINRIT